MKFTDGFWLSRPSTDLQYAAEAYDIFTRNGDGQEELIALAPTKMIGHRGDTLNRALLTVGLSSPTDGVIRVRVQHHRGPKNQHGFDLVGQENGHGSARVTATGGELVSGGLTARIGREGGWDLSFLDDSGVLTRAGEKALGYVRLEPGAPVATEPAGVAGVTSTGLAPAETYMNAQLDLGVGGLVYGLGERFGPLVKNGQGVDIWNADGGTSSEQAYKNVPFYLTNRGYGVLVNHPGHVSFEVASEAVERVQFSVPGEGLEFLVIHGPSPREILDRYTRLTGRPAHVPAWSYGLWLSTSFTTDYDEETVSEFIDGMAQRELPLSVFHFDCFWMREFEWTSFEWDPQTFPDPEGMLQRLKERGLRTSAWVNPYIAQLSPIFEEAAEAGYLVCRPDGRVWQWDHWQAGMGLVDFTNPEAKTWFQEKIRGLLHQGIDAIKTDFGERVPVDVVWFDGSDPLLMHNWYTQLYNEAVFEVLEEVRGTGDAVLFARSATTGGQRMPVHWGGDSSSSFESMAESLRGGLSLAMSGFGFWSHDIGGFEGSPDPAVFKRWLAFGLLSSHSRLHGSQSYRVPWIFDTGQEEHGQSAVEVARRFSHLKMELMPYLYQAGIEASESGMPVMRPMPLAFPDDPATAYLDRQYMLGPDILVAPVFSAGGEVTYYLPHGGWTNYLTGERAQGGAWRTEQHDFSSLPLWVRDGAVLATTPGARRPDLDYTSDPVVTLYGPADDSRYWATPGRSVTITNPTDGQCVHMSVVADQKGVTVEAAPRKRLRAHFCGQPLTASGDGHVYLEMETRR